MRILLLDPCVQQSYAAAVRRLARVGPRRLRGVRHQRPRDRGSGCTVPTAARHRTVPQARDPRERVARASVHRYPPRHPGRPRPFGAGLGDHARGAPLGRHGVTGQRQDGRWRHLGVRPVRDAVHDQVKLVPQRGDRRGSRGDRSNAAPPGRSGVSSQGRSIIRARGYRGPLATADAPGRTVPSTGSRTIPGRSCARCTRPTVLPACSIR